MNYGIACGPKVYAILRPTISGIVRTNIQKTPDQESVVMYRK